MAVVSSPQTYSRIMSPSVPPIAQHEPPDILIIPPSADKEEQDAATVSEHVYGHTQLSCSESNDQESGKKPACCRKLIHQFEREYTFHPKLNPSSLKIVHERQHQPLMTRLSEVHKHHPRGHFDKDLTFAPKLNSLSIKLAQDRAGKAHEVQTKVAALAAVKNAKFYSEYTFKPTLLVRSIRIAERLETGFLDRQQQHGARRRHLMIEDLSHPKTPQLKVNILRSKPQSTNSSPLSNAVMKPNGGNKLHKRSQTAPCLSVLDIKSSKPVALLRQNSNKIQKPLFKYSPSHSRNEGVQGLLQLDFKSLSEADRVKRIKIQAEKVMRAKKVFQIKGGYRTIRKSLRSRGWVELCCHSDSRKVASPSKRLQSINDDDDVCDSDNTVSDSDSESEEDEEDDEYLMLCRAVRTCEPYFIWSLRRADVNYHYLKKDQLINHFSGAWFTTKFGLSESLQDLPWYGEVDADTFFPRCYQLNSEEDKQIFKEDYQLTAAFNVLKIVACQLNQTLADKYGPVAMIDRQPRVIITSCNSQPSSLLSSPSNSQSSTTCLPATQRRNEAPVIPEELLLLAIKEAEAFLSRLDDVESSKTQLCSPTLTEEEWSKLLSYYYNLSLRNGILLSSLANAQQAEQLLSKLSEHCPQISMDGLRNIWIIKPGAMSRGRGILCMDHLQDILQFVNPSIVMKKNSWVVQKYIERPLIIYSTKFDIRQWFLVTDWNPLTMWMYQNCYLRFSSQLYSLEKLDTSIHLCNNSVQKHLANAQERNDKLPPDNMWDSSMFQSYLKSIGEEEKWRKLIYPGMKQAIVGVLQVAQDKVVDRKNTFELYGADFMIGTDFNPWLIEVNCSPTMERSTAVTKKLCKQVLEDTIKVVIDRRNNKDCDTGHFELAYKQTKLDVPPYMGIQLSVEGSSIRNSCNGAWRSRHHIRSIPTTLDLNETLLYRHQSTD